MANEHGDLPTLCSALIDLANERGGPDNITVVVARFEGEGLPEANGTEGIGHQTYRPAQITTVPEQAATPADDPDPGSDVTGVGGDWTSRYVAPMDRIRSLALILIILGILLLLLTVWQ